MKKIISLLITITSLCSSSTLAIASPSKLEINKKIVTEFYELAFNEHKPALAMQKFVGAKYIRAVIDIFRLEADKIVEHWDVNQEIPAKSSNTNTMF
ncbi:MAG: hypothetical protein KA715_09860 [Xanthomonadaceae bacterium]|nr:hypothetical protein [Xanthomonadaceae bacterium]